MFSELNWQTIVCGFNSHRVLDTCWPCPKLNLVNGYTCGDTNLS